jgi:arabinan endo-1,5-alpha-L-arabinosidase
MRSSALVCGALVFAAGCAALAGIEDTTTIPEGADSSVGLDGSNAGEAGASTDGGDAGMDGAGQVTRGLVAHYRFDEQSGTAIEDSSSLDLDGVLVSGEAGAPVRIAGARGGALSFSGGSYVEVARHPSRVPASPFTVAYWANVPSGAPPQGRLISDGAAFEIKINGRTMQLSLAGQYAIVTYETVADRWTHYAVVFEGGKAKWYVDGFRSSNDTDTFDGTKAPGSTDNRPLVIGTSADLQDPFIGSMDDVRIYDVALTEAELAILATR